MPLFCSIEPRTDQPTEDAEVVLYSCLAMRRLPSVIGTKWVPSALRVNALPHCTWTNTMTHEM